jgi:hypothetical protein
MAIEARPADAAQAERAPAEPNRWKRTRKNWRKRTRKWPWAAIAVFLFAVAVAVALITVGSIWASGDVPLEAAKAGLQLLAIAIFGGAVAAAFRWLEASRDELRRSEAASREEERRLDDYRAARVVELWDAYHQIKSVRRALRAAGFAAPSGKLTDEQIEAFHTRMLELNDAQLTLEKLVKLIDGQEDVFGPECASITDGISRAEQYIGHIITDWEESQAIRVGADLAEIRKQSATKPRKLWPFLDSAHADDGFKKQVSAPIRDAATKIQSLRIKTIRTDVPERELSDAEES